MRSLIGNLLKIPAWRAQVPSFPAGAYPVEDFLHDSGAAAAACPQHELPAFFAISARKLREPALESPDQGY
jgi:hypothetical protein